MKQRGHFALLYGLFALVLALNFAPTWASRNGSGTYTIPNTFSAGSTITASSHNQNFSDIANELTNSVAADGQTPMTGPLKHSNGSVSAPSITFASDADTGWYRSASNEMSAAVGGVRIGKINSDGVDAASGYIRQGGFILVPPGTVVDFAGPNVPDGWLFCYGQEVSQTTYAVLYAAIGGYYNTGGESAGNFRLPDHRGRVSAGKDDMGGSSANRLTAQTGGLNGDTLGAVGGAETHTLSTAQLPVVTPTGSVSAPNININDNKFASAGLTSGGTGFITANGGNSIGITANASAPIFTGDAFGSGQAHNNVQPTIILNKIIKY